MAMQSSERAPAEVQYLDVPALFGHKIAVTAPTGPPPEIIAVLPDLDMAALDSAILAGKLKAHVGCAPQQLLVTIATRRYKGKADNNACKYEEVERKTPCFLQFHV